MGGLASVRKNFQQEGVVPSFQFDPYGGRTTGDVTGGGGRSVMPNRDFLKRLAAMRRILPPGGEGIQGPGPMARRRPTGGGYGGITLVPPGGGYSGGVVPRFQAGGEVTWQNATPQQWAALNKPAWAPATGGWSRQARRNQHLAARGLPPSQWNRYIAPHLRDPRSLPHPGNTYGGQPVLKSNPYATSTKPPGGGYSGGVIPRFQSGEQIAQMRASQRGQGQMGLSPQDMARFRARIRRDQHLEARGLPPSEYTGPAGWEPAPRRGTPPATNPPGGWQEGGQLEDPLFPVESELADESPWYPDEEVGYEEAAPMQGGFDIFGRSGG